MQAYTTAIKEGAGHRAMRPVLEEAAHALRLKRAAASLAPDPALVATFADADCLAGDAGEDYLQRIDARCADLLTAPSDLGEGARADLNYLLSSAVIEIRADAFYPVYDAVLQQAGAPFSVAAIYKDEELAFADWLAAMQPARV